MEVIIRSANCNDLLQIHQIIIDSYVALVDYTGEEFRSKFIDDAKKGIDNDLSVNNFNNVYFIKDNHFWVAEYDNKVVGCVAITRNNADEVDLSRMAVNPDLRGMIQIIITN